MTQSSKSPAMVNLSVNLAGIVSTFGGGGDKRPTIPTANSDIGTAKIYNFLKSIREREKDESQAHDNQELKIAIEMYISTILTKYDNEQLLNILIHFGWNVAENKFDQDIIDTEGLRLALSKKARKLITRASHLGILGVNENSQKSFVPGLLLSCLTHRVNLSSPSINASSSISSNIFNHKFDGSPSGVSMEHSFSNPDLSISHAFAVQSSAITPFSVFFQGVCLVVDISGFTRLSGEYCALGKDGIDHLQRATNGYMGKLVETIYFYGGDIIKFAGDAIICVFIGKGEMDRLVGNSSMEPMVNESLPPNNMPLSSQAQHSKKKLSLNIITDTREEELRSAALQAMNCALDLREICTDKLTVHVAVSAGKICFSVLGGARDRWECLISGNCLMQIAQCLEDAPSKHVAITKEVAEIVGDSIISEYTGHCLESGNFLIERKPSNSPMANGRLQLSPRAFINTDGRPIEEDSPLSKIYNHPIFMKVVDQFVPPPVQVLSLYPSLPNAFNNLKLP